MDSLRAVWRQTIASGKSWTSKSQGSINQAGEVDSLRTVWRQSMRSPRSLCRVMRSSIQQRVKPVFWSNGKSHFWFQYIWLLTSIHTPALLSFHARSYACDLRVICVSYACIRYTGTLYSPSNQWADPCLGIVVTATDKILASVHILSNLSSTVVVEWPYVWSEPFNLIWSPPYDKSGPFLR